eukprot:scaffold1954_cov268-Pinguiococcus_pyrenoidosus.AAC.178
MVLEIRRVVELGAIDLVLRLGLLSPCKRIQATIIKTSNAKGKRQEARGKRQEAKGKRANGKRANGKRANCDRKSRICSASYLDTEAPPRLQTPRSGAGRSRSSRWGRCNRKGLARTQA